MLPDRKIYQAAAHISQMPGRSASHDDASYYRRLDVARDASHHDIARAYRRMAMGAHPDAHPEDPDAAGRFRKITEAYEVLSDPGRRSAYDLHVLQRGERVHVRHATPSNGAEIVSHLAEPVVLGQVRPRLGHNAPLRVGPVRVEGNEGFGRSAAWTWDRDDLLGRVLQLWYGR